MQNIPKTKDIDLDGLAELAIEGWRLHRWLESKSSDDGLMVPRHVARRLSRFLDQCCISIIDPIGQSFDAGLAAEVIDIVEDPTMHEEQAIICETIAPMVMWNNVAIKHAQIVVRQAMAKDKIAQSEDTDS